MLGSFDDAAVRSQCLIAATNVVDVAERAGALKDGGEGGSDAASKYGASASLFRVLLQTRAAESLDPGDAGETGVREAGLAGPDRAPTAPRAPPRERRRRRRWPLARARFDANFRLMIPTRARCTSRTRATS